MVAWVAARVDFLGGMVAGHRAQITFVGNEGVVVATPSGTVAIDALFGHGAAAYTLTPDAVIEAIEAARPPFDRIDLLLATHFHPDHFDPRSVARHLAGNPRTRFATTGQAVALMEERAVDFRSLADRVRTVSASEGVRESMKIGGIRADSFGLSHGRVNYADVEHAGWVVYAADVTMIHLGDGIIHERTLESAGVFDERIDIAFLPFWYFTHPVGRRLVESRLRSARLFAIHVPLAQQASVKAAMAADFPDATPLVRAMAQYSIE